jgi:hypothetical protein
VLAHDLLAEHHGQELVVRDLLGDGGHNVSCFLYTKKINKIYCKENTDKKKFLLCIIISRARVRLAPNRFLFEFCRIFQAHGKIQYNKGQQFSQ